MVTADLGPAVGKEASAVLLTSPVPLTATVRSTSAADVTYTAAAPLLRERNEIERAVATLKSRKNDLNEDDYYDQLEVLFVRLARLNNRIEAGQ